MLVLPALQHRFKHRALRIKLNNIGRQHPAGYAIGIASHKPCCNRCIVDAPDFGPVLTIDYQRRGLTPPTPELLQQTTLLANQCCIR